MQLLALPEVIDVRGDTRVIALAEVTKSRGSIGFVVGNSPDELRMVADRIGLRVGSIEPAWFFRIQTPVLPPTFEAKTTLGFVGSLIREHLAGGILLGRCIVDTQDVVICERQVNRLTGTFDQGFAFGVENPLHSDWSNPLGNPRMGRRTIWVSGIHTRRTNLNPRPLILEIGSRLGPRPFLSRTSCCF